jgi:hypothetical protein
MKFILTTAFIICSVLAIAQQKPKTEPVSLSRSHYALVYPADWTTDTSKSMGTDLIVLSPVEDSVDKFRENVVVMIQDLSGKNVTLEMFKQATEQQIATLVTNAKMYKSAIVKSEGVEQYEVQYQMEQGVFTLHISSVCFMKEEKAYILTFTSEFNKYERYRMVAEHLLKTFKPAN